MTTEKEPLGVFCVEGNWSADRRYSGSIRPVIELISNMGFSTSTIVRPFIETYARVLSSASLSTSGRGSTTTTRWPTSRLTAMLARSCSTRMTTSA